jgi:hypothetical protein
MHLLVEKMIVANVGTIIVYHKYGNIHDDLSSNKIKQNKTQSSFTAVDFEI